MTTNAFHLYLKHTLAINEPALNLILSEKAKRISYRKNEMIYAKGEIPMQLSFIETGNALALSQPKPNRQVLRFWVANQLICPPGFFNNMPSSQSIIALDDCEIMALNYRHVLHFLSDFPEGYAIMNSLLKAEINSVELNIRSLMLNKTPQQHEAFLDALSISFDE